VAEHGLGGWRTGLLAGGEHLLDGRVVEAVEPWPGRAEIRQDVMGPDGTTDRIGTAERVDRQAGVGG
jgi:hypothetical protein